MGALILIVVAIVLIALVVGSASQSQAKVSGGDRAPARASGRGPAMRLDRVAPRRPPSEGEALQQSETCWIPAGQTVEVSGRRIDGGMLYVGQDLVALNGYQLDPALIDPALPVARQSRGFSAANMGYWPSYSQIDASARASYLDWLASGRRDPRADIGYVFLFFYGLERRALFDAPRLGSGRADVPSIIREVEGLLGAYGENASFRTYANSFLAVLSASYPDTASLVPPDPTRFSYEVPFSVKLATGRFVAAGKPIPPDWAFAWLTHHPQIRLRTPGTRCSEEFEHLFLIRYGEKYGAGMVLKRNKTNVAVVHRLASATLREPIRIDLDVPDVTRLTGPTGRLQRLADDVQKELDPYSRWLGKTEDRSSLSAVALLPVPLARERLGADQPLVEAVERALGDAEIATVSTATLLEHWPAKKPGRLSKQEAAMVANLLAIGGIGLEPDVRFAGPNLSKSEASVVFRLDTGGLEEASSPAFSAASALLHLGAVVATADGQVSAEEEQQLREQVDTIAATSAERARLHAKLRWYLECPPSTSSLKKILEALAEPERHRIARVLLAVAGADGFVDASELRSLGKIYRLLGLDPSALYGDVHEMSVPNATAPVTILPADQERGYTVPSPATGSAESGDRVQLDVERVAAIRAETGEVSRVLGAVFADPEGEDTAADDEGADAGVSEEEGESLHGLDFAHSRLLLALAERSLWPRPEFAAIAEEYGLLVGGAIEIINEAAFNACDEPLLEGDDPVEVNPYALQEMTA